jgi:hypothetical protein
MTAPLRLPLTLLLVLALCACATARKDLGEVDVKSDPPLTAAQLITSYGFHVEEGRIFLTRPRGGGLFDFSFTEQGCLRGILSQRLQEYCPKASLPDDEPGTVRWRSSASSTTFTTRLAADGATLEVESGRNRGAFALGQGLAADELRKHPALLALAFTYGMLPQANGTAEEATRDFKYVVAQVDEGGK